MNKKLYRNSREGALSGVCAGLGEYFDVDKVWFRLIFIFSVLMSFMGVGLFGPVVYVILWIALPDKPIFNDFHARRQYTPGAESHWSPPSSSTYSSDYDVDYRVKSESEQNASNDTEEAKARPTSFYDEKGSGSTRWDSWGEGMSGSPSSSADRKTVGVILLVVGVVLLAKQLNLIIWYDLARFWPLALIAVGAYMLMKGMSNKDRKRDFSSSHADANSSHADANTQHPVGEDNQSTQNENTNASNT